MTLYTNAGRRSGDLAGPIRRSEGFDSPARYQPPVRDVRGLPPPPVTGAACPDRGFPMDDGTCWDHRSRREASSWYALKWAFLICAAVVVVVLALQAVGVVP